MKNLLIAQSGGPTAAINASLTGVIEMGLLSQKIDKVYGLRNGIEGIFSENLIELNDIVADPTILKKIYHTPGALLGSCRYKLKDPSIHHDEYQQIINVFKQYEIGYFVYIGGNDSMDTVYKLSHYCKEQGLDTKVMGVPKTIDNDLEEIDHTPGFGSAAKYVATTFSELYQDINVYQKKSVTIVEVMGRNAGWLTASSALARLNGNGPDLIYLCEKAFDIEKFLVDIKTCHEHKNNVLIAVSEGIRTANGEIVGAKGNGLVDAFGHTYDAGVGKYLEETVAERIGCKVRSIELNLMQRSSMHIASATDLAESAMLGRKAMLAALESESGRMSALKRLAGDTYQVTYSTVDIALVANHEKKVPLAWINEDNNDVTEEMMNYLKPLIKGEVYLEFNQGLPSYFKIG